MADLFGYFSNTELFYEDTESRHNLLTGNTHQVQGADNVIAGQMGSVTGDRNALFSLDASASDVSGSGIFEVRAAQIILNGQTITGSGGTMDISALLDALGT